VKTWNWPLFKPCVFNFDDVRWNGQQHEGNGLDYKIYKVRTHIWDTKRAQIKNFSATKL